MDFRAVYDNEWYSRDLRYDYDTISTSEVIRGLANRFLYSSTYKIFYFSLTLLSCTVLIMALLNPCPPQWMKFLDFVINLALIAEVAIRIVSQGKMYFKFWANIIDAILLCFCILTLFVLGRACSASVEFEEVLDALLLALRNLVQFGRLYGVLIKERHRYLNFDVEADEGEGFVNQ